MPGLAELHNLGLLWLWSEAGADRAVGGDGNVVEFSIPNELLVGPIAGLS